MEIGRQRVLVRQSIAACKQHQKEGSSVSASKVIAKGTLIRKNDSKDDHLQKKWTSTPISDKQPK